MAQGEAFTAAKVSRACFFHLQGLAKKLSPVILSGTAEAQDQWSLHRTPGSWEMDLRRFLRRYQPVVYYVFFLSVLVYSRSMIIKDVASEC